MSSISPGNECPGTGKLATQSGARLRHTTCPDCGRDGVLVRVNGTIRLHSKVGNHKMTG